MQQNAVCSRSAACAQGLGRPGIRDLDTKKALEQFAQQVRGSAEFEAKQGAARTMLSVQAKLLVPDIGAEAAEVCRVKFVEDIKVLG